VEQGGFLFQVCDYLSEGRGKNGENYPKTPPSRYFVVWLVKEVMNKVGKDHEYMRASGFTVTLLNLFEGIHMILIQAM